MNTVKLTAAAMICLLGSVPGVAQTTHWRSVDSIACDIHTDAALICREVYFRHRHTCQFPQLYNASHRIYVLSTQLHTVADGPCCLKTACGIAHEIDDLFHEIEVLVEEIKLNRCSCPPGLHPTLPACRHFAASPYRLRRLCELVTCMEGNVHQLLDQLHMRSGQQAVPPVPPVPPVVPRTPGSQISPPAGTAPGPVIPGNAHGPTRRLKHPAPFSVSQQPRSRGISVPIQYKGRTLFSFVIR